MASRYALAWELGADDGPLPLMIEDDERGASGAAAGDEEELQELALALLDAAVRARSDLCSSVGETNGLDMIACMLRTRAGADQSSSSSCGKSSWVAA